MSGRRSRENEEGVVEERGAGKRGHEEVSSEEEGESRGTKRTGRGSEGKKVVLRFSAEGQERFKKMKLLVLTREMEKAVGNVEFVKVLNDGNLLIGCESQEKVKIVLGRMEVAGVKVVSSGVVGERDRGRIRGIARVPLRVSEGEVERAEGTDGEKVVFARRLTKVEDGERTMTKSVYIEVEGQRLPAEIWVGKVPLEVREFRENPVRCYQCQGFGHMARQCRREKRCGKCGEVGHDFKGCEGKEKCYHCGGEHSTGFRGCERYKLEVVVQDIRKREGVTYAQAVRRGKEMAGEREEVVGGAEVGREEDGMVARVVRREMVKVTEALEEIRGEMRRGLEEVVKRGLEEVMEQVEQKVREERRKMVVFVAGVVNAVLKGDKVKLEERVRLVVKAAGCHLGERELKWEEVYREMGVEAGVGVGSVGKR